MNTYTNNTDTELFFGQKPTDCYRTLNCQYCNSTRINTIGYIRRHFWLSPTLARVQKHIIFDLTFA